jgi:hypothetical protein
VFHRSEDDECHSEPEHSGGEESRRARDCMRDSSAFGLRMTARGFVMLNEVKRLIKISLPKY